MFIDRVDDDYGVNTDSPLSVADWFNPDKDTCREARNLFDEAIMETLFNLADYCGIDYDTYKEWDSYDWDEFKDALGI